MGTLAAYKEPGNMTLQCYMLDQRAVRPEYLGNLGHRKGQMWAAGREISGRLECLAEVRMDRNGR